MLEFLKIKNLALIEDMELEFASGLNVMTGESGAGKSFILRALNFVLGDKADSRMIRPGKDQARIEALFSLDQEELVIRRELSASSGRSRIYLNDRLSSMEKVRQIKSKLLMLTSQHGQQQLLRPTYHGKILDSFLPDNKLIQIFEKHKDELKAACLKREKLEEQIRELEDKREMLEFQKQEIDKVMPVDGEEEELLAQKQEMQSLEQARQTTTQALQVLHSGEQGLKDNISALGLLITRLGQWDNDFEQFSPCFEEFKDTLSELESKLRHAQNKDRQEYDLDRLEQRLWELAQLKRKLRRDLPQILNLQQEIENNLSFLDQSQLEKMRLQKLETQAAANLQTSCSELNKARQEAALKLAKNLEERLRELGFSPHVQVNFEFKQEEIYPGIMELRPRLYWIPNPGQPSQPLDKIASGGELSRFLLAVTGLSAHKESAALLFDEVDAGIGGETLNKVGHSIHDLSRKRQIILISHWPQLALLADAHFLVQKTVQKNETFTLCHRLFDSEVKQELERMAGGSQAMAFAQ